jgi:uncharacterized RDD family membrane protein YckC
MIADEARAAVRAAEAASRAALEAQAAAESVLAGLEAASSATQSWEPDFFAAPLPEPVWTPVPQPVRAVVAPAAPVQAPAAPLPVRQSAPSPSFEIRWDSDLPARETASTSENSLQSPASSPWDDMPDALGPADGYGFVEAAQPIHANLIEFPRELVATRKLRPRRAEGGYAGTPEAQVQLSIFEVEPSAISTEPEVTVAVSEASAAVYPGPEWSGMQLDPEPHQETAYSPLPSAPSRAEIQESGAVEVAPLSYRLLAGVVDFSLIAGALFGAAMLASTRVQVLPSVKTMEVASAAGLAALTALYLAFFLTVCKATPGMKYANLHIRTLDGHVPTRAGHFRRFGALLLSLVPLGLGAIWALFDEHHLSWHDRLSGTYLHQGQN